MQAARNSIYHTRQLFSKMLKVESWKLFVMQRQGKTAKDYYWMIVLRQFLHFKTFYGASKSGQDLNQQPYLMIFKTNFLRYETYKEIVMQYYFIGSKKKIPYKFFDLQDFARLFAKCTLLSNQKEIDEHLCSYTRNYPTKADAIRDDLHVKGLSRRGEFFKQVTSLKDTAIEIFHEAGFKLHWCHPNLPA